MSEPHIDPAGNTQQFRAFAQRQDSSTARKQSSRLPIWIATGVALLIVLCLVAYTLIG